MDTRYPDRYVVGLTGGIASGKSSVSERFAARGALVLDADLIAREMVEPGRPALAAIAARHGPDILDASGQLRRGELRQRIFADLEEKTWLEHLLHPLIRDELHRRIRETAADYVVLAVPLLLESGEYGFVDRVLVVDLPAELQLARAMRRDQSSEPEIRRILAAQLPRQARLAQADDVIVNDGSLADLDHKVDTLHEFYKREARHKHPPG